MLDMNPMIATNQRLERNPSLILKKAIKSKRRKEQSTTKTTRKLFTKWKYMLTLNVNGLIAPIKKYRVMEWIGKLKKKKDPTVCSLQESLQTERHRLKVKGCKNIYHTNGSKKPLKEQKQPR